MGTSSIPLQARQDAQHPSPIGNTDTKLIIHTIYMTGWSPYGRRYEMAYLKARHAEVTETYEWKQVIK